MKKQSIIERIKGRIFKVEWKLAIREKGNVLLFEPEGNNKSFIPIANSLRYWKADPFLITFNGKRYLFFELYDRLKRKGLLGFMTISDDGRFSRTKVCYEIPTHLSYPHVFIENEELYCIPESSQSKRLVLLKFDTEKEYFSEYKVIADNYPVVDSTLLTSEAGRYMLTTPRCDNDNSSSLILHEIDDDYNIKTGRIIMKDRSLSRNGGKIISLDDGSKVRVSQDCSNGYGGALNFSIIKSIGDDEYVENLFLKLYPSDLNIDTTDDVDGIHTYNQDDKYEVIDYKGDRVFNIVECIGFVLNKISKRNKL